MKNLFDLIKNQEYDKIIKILKEDSDIEINIQDNFNNYFIEYVLDTGNIKLIKAVLSWCCGEFWLAISTDSDRDNNKLPKLIVKFPFKIIPSYINFSIKVLYEKKF